MKQDSAAQLEVTAPTICAHDADWQYPAATEKHAFYQVKRLLSQSTKNVSYIGFPWATLFDSIDRKNSSADGLINALTLVTATAQSSRHKVTVVQHIRLLKHIEILTSCGITNVFWSHLTSQGERILASLGIEAHPFPLFPVSQGTRLWSFGQPLLSSATTRPLLFSFVGARNKKNYMTNIRSRIIDELAQAADGHITERAEWHFNKIVYGDQIGVGPKDDAAATSEKAVHFSEIMDKSVFTLCPSGTGPNTIRLWEAIESGSIPVVLSDQFIPPGNPELWQSACVFWNEAGDLSELVQRLRAMAADAEQIAAMRLACREIALMYGRSCFAYDVVLRIAELERGQAPVAPLALRTPPADHGTLASTNIALSEMTILENLARIERDIKALMTSDEVGRPLVSPHLERIRALLIRSSLGVSVHKSRTTFEGELTDGDANTDRNMLLRDALSLDLLRHHHQDITTSPTDALILRLELVCAGLPEIEIVVNAYRYERQKRAALLTVDYFTHDGAKIRGPYTNMIKGRPFEAFKYLAAAPSGRLNRITAQVPKQAFHGIFSVRPISRDAPSLPWRWVAGVRAELASVSGHQFVGSHFVAGCQDTVRFNLPHASKVRWLYIVVRRCGPVSGGVTLTAKDENKFARISDAGVEVFSPHTESLCYSDRASCTRMRVREGVTYVELVTECPALSGPIDLAAWIEV